MKRSWKINSFLLVATVLTVFFGVLFHPLAAVAVNPTTMSFQGKVVNGSGTPSLTGTNITDGTYSFVFKLYTVSSAGTAIWTETQASVTVTAGVFQVNLGSVCPLFTANACNGSTPVDFNANPNLYLGITFNSDPAGEMTPRVQLQSVPYAFNADKVGGFSASQLVQLSPGSQQAGFINVSSSSASNINTGASAGAINLGSSTSGAITLQSASTINLTGAAASTWDIGANTLSLQTTNNGAITTGSGLFTLGGNETFSGSVARTITGPGAGGLTINDTGGNLTLSTTTSGTLAVTSAGALTLTAATASTWSTSGAAALTIQSGSGTLSLGTTTNLTATGALTIDSGTTTALGFGTGANAKTLTFGNVTGATGLVFNSGTAGATFNSVAGGQLKVTSGTNVPTIDQVLVDNTGSTGVTAAGINGLNIKYKGGAAAVEAAAERIDLTPGSTSGGIWSGLRILGAAPVIGITQNLIKGETAATTLSGAGTTTINGFNLPVAGALANTTGTLNWNGAAITTPTITQTSGSLTASGIQVTVPSSAITTGGTINGLSIPTIATGPGAGALNGISIGAITTPGAGTETAISIGNGWDTAIDIGTGFVKANGSNGLTATCVGATTLNSIVVKGGIVTGGTCQNNLTDIAEQYNSFEQLEPGDVVAPDTVYPYVKKSTSPHQANAMGIVSTAPNQVLGGSNPGYPIALIGRVPAKVNLENGPIAAGDYVTSSSTPGYAMKFSGSGQTVGIALEAYDGSQPALRINVFVNLGYQQTGPPNSVINPLMAASGALTIDAGDPSSVMVDTVASGATLNLGGTQAGAVSVSGVGKTTTVKGALVSDGPAEFNGGVTMHFSDPGASFRIDNHATTQAVEAAIQITDSGGAGYSKLISTPNFSISGGGDIVTNGTISSKGGAFQLFDPSGKQLIGFDQTGSAVFSGSLNLASASLSGGLNVGGDSNFGGLSTFQKLATFLGKAIFRQDVQFDGHVAVADDGAGYASLRVGESKVHVDFTNPYAAPPVVSAALADGHFASYSVDKVTASGFDITLQVPAVDALSFSWTAIGVNSPRTATNPLPAVVPASP